MSSYEDWNKIDEDEEDELRDASYFEGKKDCILFCIDCSESMQELYDDPNYEEVKISHLFSALDAAMQIQKKKVIVGPNDSVGILFFNTTRKTEIKGQGSEIKKNTYLHQAITPISAPAIQSLIRLLDEAREKPQVLRDEFPPMAGKPMAVGDVFTSCNWVLRDGAPKTSTKRIFLITNEDDPHSGPGSKQLITSARTTLIDLTQSGVTVEPFFISTEKKAFDVKRFYSSVLLPTNVIEDDDPESEGSVLPESISISRIEDLLAQMRFHEVPKRAQFSIPFEVADGLTIGIKGYGLVTEQKRGMYRYFVDLGDRLEVVNPRPIYVDEDREKEVNKKNILYGMALGATAAEEESESSTPTRIVRVGQRPFFTDAEVKAFRTLDREPGIKLLGFKNKQELAFEDNVRHSVFIYPDEMKFSGSKRTFTALLQSMLKKGKIAIVLALMRRNSTPFFCALLPQEEKSDDGGWNEPAGFHLIILPFADDIRAAGIEEAHRASDEMKDAARAWIDKLCVKNGAYPPDSYPNPALAYHNAQLQASAFREQFDPESFEDLTEPKLDMIHKRAGKLIKEWKTTLMQDNSANMVAEVTGSKRKADVSVGEAEIRSKHEAGALSKLRVDQLKEFCKNKGLALSGKKADLVDRVFEWIDTH